MQGRGQRAHLGVGVHRVTEANRLGQGDEAFQEGISDVFMQNQPRTGDAGLALVMEDRPGSAVDRRFQIGVFKYNVRTLATQFQLNALEVALRRFNNPPTGRG
ncbi:hypothetical protein D3C76_1206270 [compost metagenome]